MAMIRILAAINQEPGAMPGEGLTAVETFSYFVAAPVGLFLLISLIAWALTGEKRDKTGKKSSSITSID
jgi:hypothetical protein